ncbi:hypothetical protein T440DRAFT_105439 [Plenodomus tracheiphilus IPT5]|uniref:Uncharacterized protein n=1 Tax=Plenodomus tracheiphilus IPT5 TaxID=1408161 RepID=A0A6A7BLQ7_9PLEO|nr:hypothetical protein T440DRAFT_105439 [Plenodomus tracheiphilus IPT5]
MSSSALSSAAPTSTSNPSCSTADFTQFPTSDIACAIGSTSALPSNTSSTLSSCCKSAPVEKFNGNCGYYCLSVQQTVAELQACFMEGGVNPGSIFCSGNNTASATGTPTGSAGGSRVSASGTGVPGSRESTGVGAVVNAPQGVGKAGLGMLGMVVVSVIAGAFL